MARPLGAHRDMMEDVDVGGTGEDLDGEIGPEPPGAELARPGLAAIAIGPAVDPARLAAMAGIDAVADGAIAAHIHEVAEIRMRDMAVVAFQEIVDRVLPIPGDVVGEGPRQHQPLHLRAIVTDLALQCAALAGKRWGVRIEVDEDEVRQCLDPDWPQAELLPVEIGQTLAAPRGPQTTVGAIGPGVIGASDECCLAAAGQQLVGAMLAHVVEAAEHAVLATDDDDVLIGNAAGDVAAGLGEGA